MLNQRDSSLVCVSVGGPATTVIWKRDNISLQADNSDYQQIQRVVDSKTATYQNILMSSDTINFVGTFTCTVINARGSVESSLTLNGTYHCCQGMQLALAIYTYSNILE